MRRAKALALAALEEAERALHSGAALPDCPLCGRPIPPQQRDALFSQFLEWQRTGGTMPTAPARPSERLPASSPAGGRRSAKGR